MSKVKTSSGIEQIHGKTNGRDSGYFYMRNGKQFYRSCMEIQFPHIRIQTIASL